MMCTSSVLLRRRYRVSAAHSDPNSVKTDAPPEVMWDLFRCWLKENPVNERRLIKGGICTKLLQARAVVLWRRGAVAYCGTLGTVAYRWVGSVVRSFVDRSLVCRSFIRPLIPFIHPSIHPSIHAFIHFIHFIPFIHSLTHSLVAFTRSHM